MGGCKYQPKLNHGGLHGLSIGNRIQVGGSEGGQRTIRRGKGERGGSLWGSWRASRKGNETSQRAFDQRSRMHASGEEPKREEPKGRDLAL